MLVVMTRFCRDQGREAKKECRGGASVLLLKRCRGRAAFRKLLIYEDRQRCVCVVTQRGTYRAARIVIASLKVRTMQHEPRSVTRGGGTTKDAPRRQEQQG